MENVPVLQGLLKKYKSLLKYNQKLIKLDGPVEETDFLIGMCKAFDKEIKEIELKLNK